MATVSTHKTGRDKSDGVFLFLWTLPILVPALLILFAYLFNDWSWGLMDDLQLLNVTGNAWERIRTVFMMYFTFGEMKWTHAVHCAVFYKIFSVSPKAFYIFKWAEVLLMLGVWGALAAHLTRRRTSLVLVPAIGLSFHYLYDQFFFISTHETTGLLFLGLALWAVAAAEFPLQEKALRPSVQLGFWLLAVLAFLVSLGAKETFLTGPLGAGMVLFSAGVFHAKKNTRLIVAGLLLMAGAVAYGVFLKFAMASGYTSSYSFTNTGRLTANFSAWVKKDFSNHIPWVVAIVWVLARTGGLRWKDYSSAERFGILSSLFQYGLFLAILMPWNTTSYYCGPLGIFFAFGAAVLLAGRMEKAGSRALLILAAGALIFNLFVAEYALGREMTYRQDTQNLWQWIKGNNDFQNASRFEKVASDAMEPAEAIPGLANRAWQLGLRPFQYQPAIHRAGANGMNYYVHSPRFGGINDADLKGWQTMFYSKYWKVYGK